MASSQVSASSKDSINPERELLLCCARTEVDAKTAERMASLLQHEMDWEYLIRTATRHGVMPLLYRSLNAPNLQRISAKILPQSFLAALREKFYANASHSLLLAGELLKILALLTDRGIPVVSFKGPLLAASAYGNVTLRQMADLDLFVEGEYFQTAVDSLVAEGYQPILALPWETHLIDRDERYSIDLHLCVISQHLLPALPSRYVWDSVDPFTLLGTTVANIKPEAYLLLLCLNGNKECWRSLHRICDVAELVRARPDLNWQRAIAEAERMGWRRSLLLGLILSRNLLGTSLPEWVDRQVSADVALNTLAEEIKQRLFCNSWDLFKRFETVVTTLFHIETRDRWQDRVMSFISLLNHSGWLHPTANDRAAISLPAPLFFLYYPLRPFRVAWKYRHVLLDFVTRLKSDKKDSLLMD